MRGNHYGQKLQSYKIKTILVYVLGLFHFAMLFIYKTLYQRYISLCTY